MVNRTKMAIFSLFTVFGTAACAPELETGIEEPLEEVSLSQGEAQVDASSETNWVGFDLDTEGENEEDWDIAFQRFKVRLNPALGVQASILKTHGQNWETDWQVDDESDPEDPYYVFNDLEEGWFDYNLQGHVLTPKDRDYLVRTSDDNVFSVRILSYYDDAGTSAIIRFSYTQID